MLKIRMQRTGRINTPSYRIVVVEHTASPTAGRFVDKVGTYDPKSKARNLNVERIKHWMSVGAKPSATVHNMLVSLGVINAKKINVLPAYKAPAEAAAAEQEAEAAKAAEQKAKEEAKAAHEASVEAEKAQKEAEAAAPAPAEEAPKEETKAEPEAVAAEAKAE
ncbi:30S ribosomal protein S16 [Candidatus Kaiserbacteria bacterium RIFCSPHIGHO2_01_FULL_54_36]|uniref:Small ribosomal subunit protein bS16 n=1 Tax=Candidatus Kaiserbacteria bacterium RIFCSPHIGHO2_01_FULL_54_36 TaxID=1798482 RepID=A0A1F6CNV5_9BACT|nr:MAG: 30S ribosomal protein S16 [Candidatus Kaiserbacteria bacterium RIFCSPHIGHO2_01_FULL_54_36]OGG75591.1 MAG: 30S ribosomal protein S16 [Candidatus Kaiserbacteria bacterium RIFCSPLOWO2_01_FULL_54_22]